MNFAGSLKGNYLRALDWPKQSCVFLAVAHSTKPFCNEIQDSARDTQHTCNIQQNLLQKVGNMWPQGGVLIGWMLAGLSKGCATTSVEFYDQIWTSVDETRLADDVRSW